MKKHLFILSSLCLVLSACEHDDNRNAPNADNTGRNVRDRNAQAMTPGDQSESEADRTITQKIRQAIVDDNSLSTNAKNVKIITVNGVVTLRGPVNTDKERNDIAQKIRAISGVKNVDNQLEVVRTDQANGR